MNSLTLYTPAQSFLRAGLNTSLQFDVLSRSLHWDYYHYHYSKTKSGENVDSGVMIWCYCLITVDKQSDSWFRIEEVITSLPFACGSIVACCSDSFISGVRISERRFGRHQHLLKSQLCQNNCFVYIWRPHAFTPRLQHVQSCSNTKLCTSHLRLIFPWNVSNVTSYSSPLFQQRLSS